MLALPASGGTVLPHPIYNKHCKPRADRAQRGKSQHGKGRTHLSPELGEMVGTEGLSLKALGTNKLLGK